jgi:hypothetical protein
MTRLGLRRITFALLMILGVAVGRQHALDSARALFTLPGSAPISAHLAVLSGPLLTLPAVLLALLSRQVASMLLLGGSLISVTSVTIAARQDSKALAILWPYVDAVSLPMALLGAGFLWLSQLGPILRLRRLEDERHSVIRRAGSFGSSSACCSSSAPMRDALAFSEAGKPSHCSGEMPAWPRAWQLPAGSYYSCRRSRVCL